MTPEQANASVGGFAVARYADGSVRGRGRVIAYSVVPTLTIVTSSGERFSWRHDMCDESTAAEEVVARLDGYTQEQHTAGIEAARERMRRREAKS